MLTNFQPEKLQDFLIEYQDPFYQLMVLQVLKEYQRLFWQLMNICFKNLGDLHIKIDFEQCFTMGDCPCRSQTKPIMVISCHQMMMWLFDYFKKF